MTFIQINLLSYLLILIFQLNSLLLLCIRVIRIIDIWNFKKYFFDYFIRLLLKTLNLNNIQKINLFFVLNRNNFLAINFLDLQIFFIWNLRIDVLSLVGFKLFLIIYFICSFTTDLLILTDRIFLNYLKNFLFIFNNNLILPSHLNYLLTVVNHWRLIFLLVTDKQKT